MLPRDNRSLRRAACDEVRPDIGKAARLVAEAFHVANGEFADVMIHGEGAASPRRAVVAAAAQELDLAEERTARTRRRRLQLLQRPAGDTAHKSQTHHL